MYVKLSSLTEKSRLKPGSYLEIDARHAADGAVPPASGGEEVV